MTFQRYSHNKNKSQKTFSILTSLRRNSKKCFLILGNIMNNREFHVRNCLKHEIFRFFEDFSDSPWWKILLAVYLFNCDESAPI